MPVRRTNPVPEPVGSHGPILRIEACTPVGGGVGYRERYTDGAVGTCKPLDPSVAVSNFNPLGWAEALAKFLSLLMKAETWIRAGEFIGGAILILLGLRQLGAVLGVSIPLPGGLK